MSLVEQILIDEFNRLKRRLTFTEIALLADMEKLGMKYASFQTPEAYHKLLAEGLVWGMREQVEVTTLGRIFLSFRLMGLI